MKRWKITHALMMFTLLCAPAAASAANVYFDIEKRKAELQKPSFAAAKKACLAAEITLDEKAPEPIKALKSTEGYGSDNRPEAMTWQVMVLGGRTLAGDAASESKLKTLLLNWAEAGAFAESEVSHDSYYAMKRYMLPVVVNYAIIADSLSSNEREKIDAWLDKVIRPLDKKFDGDVDRNNHRQLADSVLMAWGAYSGDSGLIKIGVEGYKAALKEANADGSLDLETRRGTRASWYMRHTLASLVFIAETDRLSGGSLYEAGENGITLDHIMNYFLTSHSAPLLIMPHAAKNHIPGHEYGYIDQDHGYMHKRTHGRHYMAFAEPYIHQPTFSAKRMQALLTRENIWQERPLIDEYFGGNATCFFEQMGEEK